MDMKLYLSEQQAIPSSPSVAACADHCCGCHETRLATCKSSPALVRRGTSDSTERGYCASCFNQWWILRICVSKHWYSSYPRWGQGLTILFFTRKIDADCTDRRNLRGIVRKNPRDAAKKSPSQHFKLTSAKNLRECPRVDPYLSCIEFFVAKKSQQASYEDYCINRRSLCASLWLPPHECLFVLLNERIIVNAFSFVRLLASLLMGELLARLLYPLEYQGGKGTNVQTTWWKITKTWNNVSYDISIWACLLKHVEKRCRVEV